VAGSLRSTANLTRMAPHQWVFCFLTNFLQILISTTEGIFCQKFPGFRKTRHQISTVEKGSKICRISFKQYIYIYIWQLLSIFNIFQRIMDYIKPEVLITPATLQIQSPEKQKNTTLNPLGILMLLWVDGPSAQPLKLTPSSTKETLESLWQEKTSQLGYVLRQCYSLNLRPNLSTCSLCALMPVLKFLTVPDQLCISLQYPLSTAPF